MSSNYYTQTPNFISAASEDVDPRTRLFGFQHQLGKLTGNNGMGPTLDLTMTYSPTTSVDNFLLGTGVILALTNYDKNSFTLSLNSGEVYKTLENSGSDDDYFEIKQCKIKSFIAKKLDQNNYSVTDHDGNTTYLQDLSAGICLPVKIYTPLGRSLTLNWDYNDYGQTYLQSVIDDSNVTLLSAEYDNNNQGLILHFLPESVDNYESYTLTTYTSNGYLTQITNSALAAETSWNFEYNDVGISGLLTLTKIQTPTGLTKEVIYNGGLTDCIMAFPDDAGQEPLPAVTTLTVTPGFNQAQMVITFSPSEGYFQNYLGWGGQLGSAWDADSDNLYNVLDENYFYQTVETLVSADPDIDPIIITYTYNNYHLLVSHNSTQGDKVHEVEMTYYAEPSAGFDQQPTQFQYPKLQKATWCDTGGSYSEYTAYTYNEDGNQVRIISNSDASGQPTTISTITDTVYYSADGEVDSSDLSTGCPADPVGLPRNLKSRTTTPPVINGYDDVPVTTSFYRYARLDSLDGVNALEYTLTPVQETHTSSAVDSPTGRLLVRTMTFYTDTLSPHYGRPLQQAVDTYDINDNTGTISYPQTLDFTWDIDGDALYESQVLTTFDGLTHSSSMSYSRFTHRLWTVTDYLNNEVEITHDPIGRPISETRNKNSEYERTITTEYHLETQDGKVSAIYTLKSDELGNATRIDHDGMGRPIAQHQNAADFDAPDTWSTTALFDWDDLGRALQQTGQDFISPVDDNINPDYIMTEHNKFDNWGQHTLSIMSSGQNSSVISDPIARYTISQLQVADGSLKLGSSRSDYNELNMLISQTTRDKNGNDYSIESYEYDGIGQLRKVTDPLQHVTTYTYDPFGRISTQTLPNGDVQSWTYMPFTHANLSETVSLNKQEMGSRLFDGLGRLYSSTCGGRTQSATYTGEKLVPDTTTNASNQTLTFKYYEQLDLSINTITGEKLSQVFEYENSTGRLLSSSEGGGRSNSFSWLPSGLSDAPSSTTASGVTRQTIQTWSLLGKLMSNQDVAGNTMSITYDGFGRIHVIDDPQVTVTLTPDPAGRLYTQKVDAKNGTDSLITTLYWDDYSREQGREIAPSSGSPLYIGQTYNLNSQLETRTTTLKGDTEDDDIVLRAESFFYDERNRLTDYLCEGTELPTDAYGYTFSKQHFELNSYSNILTCDTTLSDGSVDTTTFNYENTDDPCQLTSLTHTLTSHYPASIVLAYNDDGRMTTDESGRILTYDEAGRLTNISGEDGSSEYAYDAFNTLVTQFLNNQETRELYYAGNTLMSEIQTENEVITRNIPGVSGTSAVSDESLA
ncbi:RHS repeat protein [Salmonella enterica]|nr:RHS repeat protein [Salmonella enterica]EHG9741732.1 RHS repeat protein [Salmonella enterica]